jgi:hypothetical protein
MVLDAALFYRRSQSARWARSVPSYLDPSLLLKLSALLRVPAAPACRRPLLFCAPLHSCAQERCVSTLFSIISSIFAKTPGMASKGVFQPFSFALFSFLPRNSFRSNTYRRIPRFNRNQPKSSASNPFRFNTYGPPVCNPFIRNTYKKQGEGGQHRPSVRPSQECLTSRSWPVVTS